LPSSLQHKVMRNYLKKLSVKPGITSEEITEILNNDFKEYFKENPPSYELLDIRLERKIRFYHSRKTLEEQFKKPKHL